MQRIERLNTSYYDSAQIHIHVREPYDRNTLWIQPHNGIIDVKVYDNGWKVIASTKDTGLSDEAKKQVEDLVNIQCNELSSKVRTTLGRCSADSAFLVKQHKQFQTKIAELETKIEKLTKRCNALQAKINLNGK